MSKPLRFQRSRRAGSKLPEGVVFCGRGSPFGNPFIIGGKTGLDREDAVQLFADNLVAALNDAPMPNLEPDTIDAFVTMAKRLPELRGKSLACWCGPDELCHTEILLFLANPMDYPPPSIQLA